MGYCVKRHVCVFTLARGRVYENIPPPPHWRVSIGIYPNDRVGGKTRGVSPCPMVIPPALLCRTMPYLHPVPSPASPLGFGDLLPPTRVAKILHFKSPCGGPGLVSKLPTWCKFFKSLSCLMPWPMVFEFRFTAVWGHLRPENRVSEDETLKFFFTGVPKGPGPRAQAPRAQAPRAQAPGAQTCWYGSLGLSF